MTNPGPKLSKQREFFLAFNHHPHFCSDDVNDWRLSLSQFDPQFTSTIIPAPETIVVWVFLPRVAEPWLHSSSDAFRGPFHEPAIRDSTLCLTVMTKAAALLVLYWSAGLGAWLSWSPGEHLDIPTYLAVPIASIDLQSLSTPLGEKSSIDQRTRISQLEFHGFLALVWALDPPRKLTTSTIPRSSDTTLVNQEKALIEGLLASLEKKADSFMVMNRPGSRTTSDGIIFVDSAKATKPRHSWRTREGEIAEVFKAISRRYLRSAGLSLIFLLRPSDTDTPRIFAACKNRCQTAYGAIAFLRRLFPDGLQCGADNLDSNDVTKLIILSWMYREAFFPTSYLRPSFRCQTLPQSLYAV
ncbi:hypothetical protein C8J56DRAFT_1173069 [Mycena floridula]|nr:hypothetical protein C8J56DRAFT_1173069 [Mycena floridula]